MLITKEQIKGSAEAMLNCKTKEDAIDWLIENTKGIMKFTTAEAEEVASYLMEEITIQSRIRSEMESFKESFDFCNWGWWGVTDFYGKAKNALRTAIESGKCFNTEWHYTVETFDSAKICRDREGIVVSVFSDGPDCMEQEDLFCDFLTEEEVNKLTDEMVEEIRNYLDMGDYVQEIEYEKELPFNATFEEVVACMNELADDCRSRLHESFLECISTTLYVLYDMTEKENDEEFYNFVRERQNQFN